MANGNKDSLNIIDQFILILENIPKYKNCFNPFNSDNNKKDILRKNNLRLYLTKMKEIDPNTIIIGEAPGYCRISESETPVYEKTANTIWNILLSYKNIKKN
jgi:hypothetical protein